MSSAVLLASLSLLAAVAKGQQAGTVTAEKHPALSVQSCTASGCTTEQRSVVLDANWRWLHTTSGYTNCYTGDEWDTSICTDGATCAAACALDGADYEGTYGITASSESLKLQFVTGSNVGSRVYLMETNTTYQMFNLLNNEFTFTVDVSNLPCGLNGALYFVEMDEDGGLSEYSTNKAGAAYGTGYCDSQCPKDIKFIDGVANVEGWNGTDSNSGTGDMGSCCSEMDIWEANSQASAYTPHPCTVDGQTSCTGTDCGAGSDRYNGVCDADGCDFNSFRMGDKSFYGTGMTVDTSSPFTVVTQFITDDGTDTGTLTEIRRIYVQDGEVIQNSKTNIAGMADYNSITEDFCTAQKTAFGDTNSFEAHGGLAQMGKALEKMVLVMSVWDDHAVDMLWLDSDYPTTSDASTPGIARGNCSATSGDPATVESGSPNASVTFSNIKFGALNSTYSA